MSSSAIRPRWEWRCFARSLAALAQRGLPPAEAAARESDETYILDLKGPISENLKVREGVLDVKRLLRTDADGLELWMPVLKAPFPLSREDVAAVFAPWTAASALHRRSYSLQELTEDIIAKQATLRLIRVRKSRRGFVFAGCLAELADIRAESMRMQTFSLEHEDPQRLLAALRLLGLDARGNTNYVLGLRRALGLEPAAL